MKKTISVIVSCFNEAQTIPYFYEAINQVANQMDILQFEFLFVNDGSSDETLSIIKQYARQDSRIRYVSFSRNFGKEAAMYAGLQHCTGDYVTLMDADLQDPPSLLPKMYEYIAKQGYDQVATKRATRKGEPKLRSLFANIFYKIINKMSQVEMVSGARDYRLMSRKVVDAILELKEVNRYSKGIFSYVGFETKWLEYDNIERVAGYTKWSFIKLFHYAIEGILSFTTSLLSLASILGIFTFCISIILIVIIVIRTLLFADPVSGWPSTICIILLIGGLQLFCLGVIGEYLGKNYLETKNRPIYIVKETESDIRLYERS